MLLGALVAPVLLGALANLAGGDLAGGSIPAGGAFNGGLAGGDLAGESIPAGGAFTALAGGLAAALAYVTAFAPGGGGTGGPGGVIAKTSSKICSILSGLTSG